MLSVVVVTLLSLLAPRPAPPSCSSVIVLAGDDFEGYYAVYWNRRLICQGRFVYDMSLSVSLLLLPNGEKDQKAGFCVGKVLDRNEMVIKNRAGKTIFRRHLRKQEVAPVLWLNKYEGFVSLTPRTDSIELE